MIKVYEEAVSPTMLTADFLRCFVRGDAPPDDAIELIGQRCTCYRACDGAQAKSPIRGFRGAGRSGQSEADAETVARLMAEPDPEPMISKR